MAEFIAKVLKVEKDSNPEYAFVRVLAKSKEAATELALKEAKGGAGWGWTSYGDADLWGKKKLEVVECDKAIMFNLSFKDKLSTIGEEETA